MEVDMFKTFAMTVAGGLLMVSLSTFGIDVSGAQTTIELKDGSTVYVFGNGRMGMTDRYGRVARMQPGVPMKIKNGQTIVMIGDEVARVQAIKNHENQK
jgi:hypothetical protein